MIVATDIGFIDLNRAAQAVIAVHNAHELPDFVAHPPRGLVGHA